MPCFTLPHPSKDEDADVLAPMSHQRDRHHNTKIEPGNKAECLWLWLPVGRGGFHRSAGPEPRQQRDTETNEKKLDLLFFFYLLVLGEECEVTP